MTQNAMPDALAVDDGKLPADVDASLPEESGQTRPGHPSER
jgi:hypothetical protein